MGHYASEMAGEGLSEERALELIAENRRSLKARWENGLSMSVAYPFSTHEYNCPRCFAKVESNFLSAHDAWHDLLMEQMAQIARWTQPGLLG